MRPRRRLPQSSAFAFLNTELASGRAFDTHLVLDTANGNATVALVVDKHREASAVMSSFLRAGKNEMNIGIAVGDETFYSVETPCAVRLLGRFKHYRLKVGAGVGLGEVHRHGLAGAYAGNITLLLVIVGKFVDGLGAVLQTPEGLETCIGATYDFSRHDIRSDGEVETAETTGHCHAHDTCFTAYIEVMGGTGSVRSASVGTSGTGVVNFFSVVGNSGTAYIAYDFEHLIV